MARGRSGISRLHQKYRPAALPVKFMHGRGHSLKIFTQSASVDSNALTSGVTPCRTDAYTRCGTTYMMGVSGSMRSC